ncbi:MAG: VUT family protein [Bacteroidales bacterium]|nr:VUT family protein [Bacteroidales bacterium]
MKEVLRKIPPMVFAVLVLSVVSMNLLANKELFRADWIALDCGFLLSWIPFLIMDAVCKVHGGRTAATLSILAIGVNLVLFLIFKLVALTPGMWGEYYANGGDAAINDALNATIGGSTWIVLGSAFSMAVSSVANSLVNSGVGRIFRGDGYGAFAARSFVSTMVSQFLDNLIFALLVSVRLFGWTLTQTLVCSLSAALFELVLEVVFSGYGYKLSKTLKSNI